MKKIYSLLLIAASVLGLTTSCSDIPMPYDIASGQSNSFGKKLPYKSTNLNTGWTTNAISENEPWSQESNYTQATGYQDWDGDGTKSNVAVESYLISPALNTTCESGKVSFSFDYTIRYESKVSNWKENHKIFVSKDYDGINFDEATWEQIAWTPAASTTNDWTLYTSGSIAVPEDYVNRDSIYFAFYFKAPADASTTWELENFLIQEGEGGTSSDDPSAPDTGNSSKEAPYTVAQAKAASGNAYVKGYIVGYIDGTKLAEGAKFEVPAAAETEILLADTPDETNPDNLFPVQLPTGDIRNGLELFAHPSYLGQEVILYGSLETYFGTMGMKSTSWAKIGETEIGKDPSAPEVPMGEAKGAGTEADPYNVAAIASIASKLASGETSTSEYYFKGKVSSITEISASFGNATFYISDDGSSNNTFYIYRALGLNNSPVTDESFIKVGDEVVICGKITNYNGKLETSQKAAYVYSINGSKESASGSEEGDKEDNTPTGTSEGVSIYGTTVTLTNSAVKAGTATATIDLNEVAENGTEVTTVTLSDGSTITFDKGSNKNAPKYYTATKGIRFYSDNILTVNGKSPIAKVVMTCDSYQGTDYVGSVTATVSFEGNNAVYNNVNDGKNTQLRIQTITVTYAK